MKNFDIINKNNINLTTNLIYDIINLDDNLRKSFAINKQEYLIETVTEQSNNIKRKHIELINYNPTKYMFFYFKDINKKFEITDNKDIVIYDDIYSLFEKSYILYLENKNNINNNTFSNDVNIIIESINNISSIQNNENSTINIIVNLINKSVFKCLNYNNIDNFDDEIYNKFDFRFNKELFFIFCLYIWKKYLINYGSDNKENSYQPNYKIIKLKINKLKQYFLYKYKKTKYIKTSEYINSARLRLNGKTLINRDTNWWNNVELYNKSNLSCPTGLYFYSFALNPLSFNPSGSANFTILNNSEIDFEIDNNLTSDEINNTEIKVFTKKYNYIRIMGNMAYKLW